MTGDEPPTRGEDSPSRVDEAAGDDGAPHRQDDADHGGPHDDDHDHDHHAPDLETVQTAVVTVSSTRDLEADPAGDAVQDAMEAAGHEVVIRELVADDHDGIQSTVGRLADRDDVDCVVTTGGTGVSPDDVTVEAVEPLLDSELPGFGELFRRRSESEIGTRAIATRATAGLATDVLVCCLPGSEPAARLGTAEIVAPEAGHLVGLARR